MKNLQEISKTTGISVVLLRNVLGAPSEGPPEISNPCDAMTVREVREKYLAAPRGSDDEHAALLRWVELCRSVEEVQVLYRVIHRLTDDGRDIQRAALMRICELSPDA